MPKHPHEGSNFDDFLIDEGLLSETTASAIKRVIALQIEQCMKDQHLSKTSMAAQLNTSRSALERLLDPDNTSVSLHTLARAATVLGKQLDVSLKMS